MYFIAHRGNTTGPGNPEENRFDYLKHAYYDLGYGIELDIQTHNGKLYLGHDDPQEPVDADIEQFMRQERVFTHAKDLHCIPKLLTIDANVFYHTEESIVFTSKGYIWCYPGIFISDIKRAVWNDYHWGPIPQGKRLTCLAVCGDDVRRYDINTGVTKGR